jgi:hypothetical protein
VQPCQAVSVLRAVHTAIRGERVLVVRTSADWEELWREHTSAQVGTAPAPQVDFATRMVVGVVLDTCPTGGYSVEIRRVERRDGSVRVVAHRTAPDPNSARTMVLTKPLHFVSIERSDAPIELVWE